MADKKTVYICDDDKWILDTIADFIQDLGLNITKFSDGKAALEQITQNRPDLIITDIDMPQMSGLELLRHLEQNAYSIPVIILTGSLDIRNLQEAVAYGHFDYLNKPLKPFDLIEAINKALIFGYQPSVLSRDFLEQLKRRD